FLRWYHSKGDSH
ncbi:unnamed protein product, partial [Rotaria magnacalcarata]